MNHLFIFDGVCNLCHGSVQFLLKRDKDQVLSFTSNQSETAQAIFRQFNVNLSQVDSVMFLEDGKLYAYSDAVLTSARYLRFPWNLLSYFVFIPRSLRDLLYKFVAKNRYSWFGKKDVCPMPDPDVMKRFYL